MSYRLRKFARKHRTVLATAATIVLLLVIGGAISTWQAVRATHAESETAFQRDRAIEAERDALALQTKAQQEERRAVRSAEEATVMCSFFKELTEESRRTIKLGDDWRAKTVDEALATVVNSETVRALFAGHPLAEAEIRQWLATTAFPGQRGTRIWAAAGFAGTPPNKTNSDYAIHGW